MILVQFSKILVALRVLQMTHFAHAEPRTEMNLIADVANFYEGSKDILAFVCWSAREKAVLSKWLSTRRNPVTIRHIKKSSEYFHVQRITHHTIIVVDGKCPESRAFLNHASETQMFRNSQRWLILNEVTNESSTFRKELRDLHILLDSEVIIANQQVDIFELELVYKTKSLGWMAEQFGIWTSSSGLQTIASMKSSHLLRRKNLGEEPLGITLAVTQKNNVDLQKLHDQKQSNSVDIHAKFGNQYMSQLCEFLNATPVPLLADDWGYFINNSWNGMIGDIVRGEAELVGVPMFMTLQRLGVVYYLTNPAATAVKFVFREPPLSYQNNLFILPFGTGVWLCSAGFVILLTLVLYINSLWAQRKMTQEQRQESPKQGLSDVVMLVVSAITQQGNSFEIKGTIGKLLTFILFTVFLFLYASYSASIVALLQSRSNQIHNLKDLLESRLELGSENTTYNRYLFKTETEPVRKAIYETKIAPRDNWMTLEDGVNKIRNSPFGFNMDLGPGYRIIKELFYEHEKCGLHEIAFVPPQRPWVTCRKDSPYAQLYKLGLREFGFASRLNRLLHETKPACNSGGGSFTSVNLVDVYPLLLMLLYGVLLSVALLLLEIAVHRWNTRLDRQSETYN